MLEMVAVAVAVAAAADIVVGNLVAVAGNLVVVAVGRVGFGMNRNPCLEREGDRKGRLDAR